MTFFLFKIDRSLPDILPMTFPPNSCTSNRTKHEHSRSFPCGFGRAVKSSAERGDCRWPLTPALTSVSGFFSSQTPREPLWAWQWPWNSFLQSTSDLLCLVLFSFQEFTVHLVASVQVENYRVPCDRPLCGSGGSILLCSAGKLFSIRIKCNVEV